MSIIGTINSIASSLLSGMRCNLIVVVIIHGTVISSRMCISTDSSICIIRINNSLRINSRWRRIRRRRARLAIRTRAPRYAPVGFFLLVGL